MIIDRQKKHFAIACLVFVSAFWGPPPVTAAEISWTIRSTELDSNSLQSDANGQVKAGFMPIGISVDRNRLYVLYLKNPKWSFTEWRFADHASEAIMRSQLSEQIRAGWFPVGLAILNGRYYTLSLKGLFQTAAFDYASCAINADSINQTINSRWNKKLVPVGFDSVNGGLGFLMVSFSGQTVDQWSMGAYQMNDAGLAAQIDAKINEGFVPVDILVAGNLLNVLYLRFSQKTGETGVTEKSFVQQFESKGPWVSRAGAQFTLDLKKNQFTLNAAIHKRVFSVNKIDPAPQALELTATLTGVEATFPADYPETLKEADLAALTAYKGTAGSFLFKITSQPHGAVVLSEQSPGAKHWVDYGRFTRLKGGK